MESVRFGPTGSILIEYDRFCPTWIESVRFGPTWFASAHLRVASARLSSTWLDSDRLGWTRLTVRVSGHGAQSNHKQTEGIKLWLR